jgi:glycosyltransferase involved in cell wall biosynthesis
MYSLIIPVYKNEESIPSLLDALEWINGELDGSLEVVFVVDGSPDRSYEILEESLKDKSYDSELVLLARNFGSFAALRSGLEVGNGPHFAVMAADLQEPPDLIVNMFRAIREEGVDIALGVREKRSDPLLSKMASGLFWGLYRRLILKEVPPGGIDVFACNEPVRDVLLSLKETNTTLVGLLVWAGFERKLIGYERQTRQHGKSAWGFGRKLRYMLDSAYAFSNLPIVIMQLTGGIGTVGSLAIGAFVFLAWATGNITVEGYTPIILTLFLSTSIILLGMGIIGSYVWRTFENTKRRPLHIVMRRKSFPKGTSE